MPITDQTYHVISIILAAGAVCGPLFFGYLNYRLTERFTTRAEFAEYKLRADSDRDEIKERLEHIAGDVTELLQRTAAQRPGQPGQRMNH